MTADSRPTLALALGDAAGIGPELAAKALADEEVRQAARFVVIGDKRLMELGAEQAGVDLEISEDWFLERDNLDPETVTIGEASELTGAAALDNFGAALTLCHLGGADATCFTPFNKHAMRLARPEYVDEIGFIQAVLGTEAEGAEFNVLDELWNARVTSHVPLSEVSSMITQDRVLERIKLTDATMQGAGQGRPRIAVAALNPHAGDGGNFGPEDDDIIAPAVREAQQRQINVSGPWPSDTVYLRAHRGEFDVVLSMYHDQGQIAMKLIGFDRGVTLIGGYPFWIATPAHGTAYDIAGQGNANPQATKNALLLAAKLARASDVPLADDAARRSAIKAMLDAPAAHAPS
ncbi:MAG: 4-hydroxythreonine-4-phosphate dehydrogenase PdxA [Pseudomonadota bacterium]